MRIRQLYVCECCGKKSCDASEIERCEAAHMGLSVNEKRSWDSLKSAAKYFGYLVSATNNERTRAEYDEAIEELVLFEKEHNIK